MAVKHTKVLSGITDSTDTTLVRPSNWNANHDVEPGTILLNHLAPAARGFDYLGGIELGSAQASTGILTFPQVDVLLFLGNVGSVTPSDRIALRFNGDSGPNYTWTNLQATAGLVGDLVASFAAEAGVNATYIQLHRSVHTTARNMIVTMANAGDRTKVGGVLPAVATGDAATRGLINTGCGEYHSLPWITKVEMFTVAGGLMDAGSIIMAFGKNIP